MDKVYSVGQINAYIKNLFSQDYMLRKVSVSGEVSNCKYHNSGHIYFTLKEDGAAIACVMFAGSRGGLAFAMKDGDRVVVTGSVEVYERDGRYQLYARKIELEGAGLLYERFLKLKADLEEMGMFAAEYKRPIPTYVRRLGVVTAPAGAAIQDIRNVALRRDPYVQLILFPAKVQGEGAAESVAQGIEALDALGVDAIIVGRGGGSIEDLWAFNEEIVARAIFACNTPVISAVGHETDVTISDFVADLRAPTPSAAAELAVQDIRGILERLQEARTRLRRGAQQQVRYWRDRAEDLTRRWKYLSPESQLRERRQRAADLEERLHRQMTEILEQARAALAEKARDLRELSQQSMTRQRHRLQLAITKLEGLSPLAKLNQGYAKVETREGRGVAKISEVAPGQELLLHVTDGRIDVTVQGTKQREEIK